MYVDIYYSGGVVQKGATFPSRGACLQLNLSPTLQGVHSLMWNCWIMHLWVFAQSHTDPLRHHLQRVKHNKKKQTGEYNRRSDWPCQMLARGMNFHLITFELIQLLPYRCLRNKSDKERKPRCVPSYSHAVAQVVKLKWVCCENGETSVVEGRIR